jgi:hypothetical protein
MALYNFQKRFAPKILSGLKQHTIRADRKDGRLPKPGEMLHLYTGLRQKGAQLLMRVRCTKVERITIRGGFTGAITTRPLFIAIDDVHLLLDECEQLARSDGFESLLEMVAFWRGRTPFKGHIIYWNFEQQTNSGEKAGHGVQTAMSANGMPEFDRPETQAAKVLLRRVPTKRRPRNAQEQA